MIHAMAPISDARMDIFMRQMEVNSRICAPRMRATSILANVSGQQLAMVAVRIEHRILELNAPHIAAKMLAIA